MESFKYEHRKRMSGDVLPTSRSSGAKSFVESGYLVSETIRRPFFSAFTCAPAIGLREKSASAARIATVWGFGFWRAATSKNPAVSAVFGSGPVGIIAK